MEAANKIEKMAVRILSRLTVISFLSLRGRYFGSFLFKLIRLRDIFRYSRFLNISSISLDVGSIIDYY